VHNDTPGPSWPQPLRYLVCYTLWLGLCALGIWVILRLRIHVVAAAIHLKFGPWVVIVVDRWVTILLGLLGVVGVVLLEGYLHDGMKKNQLWRRATRVLFGVAALGLSYGLQFLLG
jgi:hypothetical protein